MESKSNTSGHQEDRCWQQTPAKFTVGEGGGCVRVLTLGIESRRAERERERERRQANEHVCVIERDAGPLIKPLSSCKTSLPTPHYSQVMLHISRHCHPSGSWISLHNKHQPVVVYTHTRTTHKRLSYRDYRGRPAQHTQTCRCAQKNNNKTPGWPSSVVGRGPAIISP